MHKIMKMRYQKSAVYLVCLFNYWYSVIIINYVAFLGHKTDWQRSKVQ